MEDVAVALPSFDFGAELLQRLFLNLPDALAGDAEMLADDFKGFWLDLYKATVFSEQGKSLAF